MYSDPTGHEIKPPPCVICDITWLNYSNIAEKLNKTVDAIASFACAFAGCHVDANSDTIQGPTVGEFWEDGLVGMATPIEIPTPSFSLQGRVSELHGLLDFFARNKRTTAIVSAQAPNGSLVYIVASSADRLSPAQRAALYRNEIEAIGLGHAEVTALDYADQMNLTPLEVAASRPICPECAGRIIQSGALRITRLKEGR